MMRDEDQYPWPGYDRVPGPGRWTILYRTIVAVTDHFGVGTKFHKKFHAVECTCG